MTNPITIANLTPPVREALFEFLLRIGDDRLVLGHRVSEWCGHAPILEEDIALANVALDLLGHASMALKLAGEVEGKGRTEDSLAYLRDPEKFRNLQLTEQPNGDFAFTIVRQFFFDAFSLPLMTLLQKSPIVELAGIAAKATKEDAYHLRHSAQWVLRLGDGTAESHARAQDAVDELWRFTREPFEDDIVVQTLEKAGIVPEPKGIRAEWEKTVSEILKQATLTQPKDSAFMATGARIGHHTEHLGPLLAEMQVLPRSFPGASW